MFFIDDDCTAKSVVNYVDTRWCAYVCCLHYCVDSYCVWTVKTMVAVWYA